MLDTNDLPTEEWKQTKAAYLSLTPGVKQGATQWQNRFPKIEIRQNGWPTWNIGLDGTVQSLTSYTWRVKYQYYAGIDSRSYYNWPNYVTTGWVPAGLFKPRAPMHVVTESGQAIYVQVSEQKRWSYDTHPAQIYALWRSEGTVKPRKASNKESQDQALLEQYSPVEIGNG